MRGVMEKGGGSLLGIGPFILAQKLKDADEFRFAGEGDFDGAPASLAGDVHRSSELFGEDAGNFLVLRGGRLFSGSRIRRVEHLLNGLFRLADGVALVDDVAPELDLLVLVFEGEKYLGMPYACLLYTSRCV